MMMSERIVICFRRSGASAAVLMIDDLLLTFSLTSLSLGYELAPGCI